MTPKVKVSKEQIISAGLELVRERGQEGLNARAIAGKLGCSTQPVFSNYASMDALKDDVMKGAYDLYMAYLERGMADPSYPPYKQGGMAYIRFAKEETELFRLLFMRDRSGEQMERGWDESGRKMVRLISENTGLSREEASLFHLEMWVYVHGIASMIATGYLLWDEEMVSAVLTDAFLGLKLRYGEKNARTAEKKAGKAERKCGEENET